MATDGPDPIECNPEILRDGTIVAFAETHGANAFEAWIQRVREDSGQRVDWHYVGGRAVVKVIGDAVAVKQAMVDLQHLHSGVIVYGKPRWRR